MSSHFTTVRRWLGIQRIAVSQTEKLVSALGGLTGILLIYALSSLLLDGASAQLIIASMGASAVLLFAVPHGPLSQPWPLLGGHLLGAVVGVGCAMLPLPISVNAALAVGLAIGLMHVLGCTHPPGGATALTAVIGGAGIHQLGFSFVLMPVALNAVVLLAVAIVFNYPLRWRRYPAALAVATESRDKIGTVRHPPPIDHAHLVAALSEIDSYLDISEHDLLRIYELATRFADADAHADSEIVPGGYYSNGRFGQDWEVREVRTINDGQYVEFAVVAGSNRRHCGRCSLATFRRWAAHPVIRDENSWRPIEPSS